jgi:hypothetical protein
MDLSERIAAAPGEFDLRRMGFKNVTHAALEAENSAPSPRMGFGAS